jgi:hypothetical protein
MVKIIVTNPIFFNFVYLNFQQVNIERVFYKLYFK